MRGEHLPINCCASCIGGSSPHARGALPAVLVPVARAGIIPACAGSTQLVDVAVLVVEDHPRMRGEHPLPWTPTLAGGGSSPHARGAHTGPEQGTSPRRIIPACAGSTRSWGNIGSPQRDHPRMRGEHDGIYAAYRGDEGSSPHARGAPVRHVGQDLVAGIIPACAGSTIRCGSGRTWRQDHPRMRGEHFASNATSAASQGSSPHARGALMSSLSVASTPWDHPRMRGEHEIEVGSIVASPGSSPHARGAHLNTCGFAQDSSESHSLYQSHQRLTSGQKNTPITSSCPALSGPHGGIAERDVGPSTASRSVLLGPPVLACRAPALFLRADKRRVIRAHRPLDEANTLGIDVLPVWLKHLKRQMLLVASRIHHDCPPLASQVEDPRPKSLPHPRRHMAHVHTGRNLEKPARQVTAEPLRAGRENNYHHSYAPPSSVAPSPSSA